MPDWFKLCLESREELLWRHHRICGAKSARDRTDLARQRNLLANERTFSAWLRTGLSAVVAGLAIARLLGSVDSLLVARSIGVILVLTGGGIYVLAFWRYGQVSRSLEQENMSRTVKGTGRRFFD